MSSAKKETTKEATQRFVTELEFVQCLADPWYLFRLAQQGWFEKPAFIAYLEYLVYWFEPQYAQHVMYPHALHYLRMLQQPEFRKLLLIQPFVNAMEVQQQRQWTFNNA